VSREKCLWVTGIISNYLMGKQVKYDVLTLVAELVEHVEGGYMCRFCGYTGKVNGMIAHLRRKHCNEVVEAWDRVKPKPLYRGGVGRPIFMKIAVQCRSCGHILLFKVPANYGPPNLKQFIAKQYMQGALGVCPSCGRTLGFWDGELKFIHEKEVLGK
jgi:hypothetical protein